MSSSRTGGIGSSVLQEDMSVNSKGARLDDYHTYMHTYMQDTYLSFLSMCTRAYMILHTQHTKCLAMSNRVNHSTRRGGFSTLVTQSIATGSVTGCGLVFFRFETKSSNRTVDKVHHSLTICLKFQHHHHSLGHFLSCPNTHTHTHTHTHNLKDGTFNKI